MIFSLLRFLSFDPNIPPAWNAVLLYLPYSSLLASSFLAFKNKFKSHLLWEISASIFLLSFNKKKMKKKKEKKNLTMTTALVLLAEYLGDRASHCTRIVCISAFHKVVRNWKVRTMRKFSPNLLYLAQYPAQDSTVWFSKYFLLMNTFESCILIRSLH